MKWTLISASWCSACLITKKQIKTLQKEFDLEVEVLDIDFDDDQLKGIELGKVLPIIYHSDQEPWVLLAVGEKSLEELRKVYLNANS